MFVKLILIIRVSVDYHWQKLDQQINKKIIIDSISINRNLPSLHKIRKADNTIIFSYLIAAEITSQGQSPQAHINCKSSNLQQSQVQYFTYEMLYPIFSSFVFAAIYIEEKTHNAVLDRFSFGISHQQRDIKTYFKTLFVFSKCRKIDTK